MSDTPTPSNDAPPPGDEPTDDTSPDPTTAPDDDAASADPGSEEDRLRAEIQKLRKWEKIGKANKAAADRLAEIEEASKSDLDRAVARAEAADARAAAAESELLRLTVAARHGITGEHIDLLHGADEDELEAKAQKVAALIARDRDRPAVGPYVPPEGTATRGNPQTTAEKFAAAVERTLA